MTLAGFSLPWAISEDDLDPHPIVPTLSLHSRTSRLAPGASNVLSHGTSAATLSADVLSSELSVDPADVEGSKGPARAKRHGKISQAAVQQARKWIESGRDQDANSDSSASESEKPAMTFRTIGTTRFRRSLSNLALVTHSGSFDRATSRANMAVHSVKDFVVKHPLAPPCRILCKSWTFQTIMFLAVMAALFLPDIWILADRPDNSDLDIVLTLVFSLFIFELVVQCIGMSRTYLGSFFFWMDLLGAASLVLDISFMGVTEALGGSSGLMTSNAVVMRTARIAKLGARAGRATELLHMFSFIPGIPKDNGTSVGTAKRISARLISSLSMRVSGLVILMVSVMPFRNMWTFPSMDWSMKGWAENLELSAIEHPDRFARQLLRYESFFEDLAYYPFEVSVADGSDLPDNITALLPWKSSRGAPKRSSNEYRLEGDRIVCVYDMGAPIRWDALMNVLLLAFVICVMVGFSLILSNTVSEIVLTPLQNLLSQVHQTAALIFKSVSDMASALKPEASMSDDDLGGEEDDFDAAAAFRGETDLLEKVVRRLQIMSEATARPDGEEEEDRRRGLAQKDRAMIAMLGGMGFRGEESLEPTTVWRETDLCDDEDFITIFEQQQQIVEMAGLSLDQLNSWNLNPLELDRARNHAAALYSFGSHHHGLPFSPVEMGKFLEEVESSYSRNNPYHTWYHAVDVNHCVYRFMQLCSCHQFLTRCDRFALVLSATCHDIGHPGLSNSFLIESSDDLALTYNDNSPLEMMHCAKLFEVLARPRCDALGKLSKGYYQEVRRLCVDAILMSDFSKHFTLIKDIQVCCEVHAEILDEARNTRRKKKLEGDSTWMSPTVQEALRTPETRGSFVNLLLHLADLSNSLKPFRIARLWAQRQLEENLIQGDMEKDMGLPLLPLNDRSKVCPPLAQISFIEFLVSPLLYPMVKILPPLQSSAEQLVLNAKMWQSQWVKDHKPTETEQTQLSDRVMKLQSVLHEVVR